MTTLEFKSELQIIASEMGLTKNRLTVATESELVEAAKSCSVEEYSWETSTASFLIRDNVVKGARLFDNGEEIELLSNGLDADSLYVDFKEGGKLI